jgi:hypothetical protein
LELLLDLQLLYFTCTSHPAITNLACRPRAVSNTQPWTILMSPYERISWLSELEGTRPLCGRTSYRILCCIQSCQRSQRASLLLISVLTGRRPCRLFRWIGAHRSKAVSAVLTDQCSLVGGHVGRSDGSVLAGRRPCRLFRRVSAHWSKAVSTVSPGQCSTVEGRPFRHLSFKPVPTKAPSLCADKRPCKFFPLTYTGHLLKILSA